MFPHFTSHNPILCTKPKLSQTTHPLWPLSSVSIFPFSSTFPQLRSSSLLIPWKQKWTEVVRCESGRNKAQTHSSAHSLPSLRHFALHGNACWQLPEPSRERKATLRSNCVRLSAHRCVIYTSTHADPQSVRNFAVLCCKCLVLRLLEVDVRLHGNRVIELCSFPSIA